MICNLTISSNETYIHCMCSWNLTVKLILKLPSGKGNTCSTFGFPLNNPMTNDFDSVGYK